MTRRRLRRAQRLQRPRDPVVTGESRAGRDGFVKSPHERAGVMPVLARKWARTYAVTTNHLNRRPTLHPWPRAFGRGVDGPGRRGEDRRSDPRRRRSRWPASCTSRSSRGGRTPTPSWPPRRPLWRTRPSPPSSTEPRRACSPPGRSTTPGWCARRSTTTAATGCCSSTRRSRAGRRSSPRPPGSRRRRPRSARRRWPWSTRTQSSGPPCARAGSWPIARCRAWSPRSARTARPSGR